MSENLFREKSIERISSPEQLNDYIKVTRLGVWFIMGVVILFLAVVCIWGFTGTIDNTVEEKGYSDGENIYCYLTEEQVQDVCEGQKGRVGDISVKVESVSEVPDGYSDIISRVGNEKAVHALRISEDDWKYLVILSSEKPVDGFVDISITTDSVSPIAYLFD